MLDTDLNKQSKKRALNKRFDNSTLINNIKYNTRQSKNNAIKNTSKIISHADNSINRKPNLKNENNDVISISSTFKCKQTSIATKRGRRKKEMSTLSNETNIPSIRGSINCTFTTNKNCETQKSLRNNPNNSILINGIRLKTSQSMNNTNKNTKISKHADNYINQKPHMKNIIEESNDETCISNTFESKETATATRRRRKKKTKIRCGTRKSLRIKNRQKKIKKMSVKKKQL